jgi:predicted nucleic acid-binding protein
VTAQSFVDTNILIYAASNAPEDQAKRLAARDLLTQPDIGFSAQVLQEFYVAATGKKRLLMTHEDAVAVLGAILAAAKALGCQTLYSEDLSHGQEYDGVRVVNPFLTASPAATP